MPLLKNLEAMTKAVINEPMPFVVTFIAQILVLIGLVIASLVVLALFLFLIGIGNTSNLMLILLTLNQNLLPLGFAMLILVILFLLFFSLSLSLSFNANFYYYKKGQFSIKNAFDPLIIKKLIGGSILDFLPVLLLLILDIIILYLMFYPSFAEGNISQGTGVLFLISVLALIFISFVLLLPLQTFLYRVYANKNINVVSVFTNHLGLYKNKEHWIFLIKFFILSIIIGIILNVINLILSYIPCLGPLVYLILNALIGMIFGATIFKELDDLGLLYIKK
jgi:hypothetical protein